MELERRIQNHSLPMSVELRHDGATFRGYAAVHYNSEDSGTEFRIGAAFKERITPGAFKNAILRGDDARGLFNHDPNQLLGRVGSGTMSLSQDGVGLRYTIRAGNTSIAQDLAEHIKRGDITGSSFAFVVDEEEWIQDPSDNTNVRLIKDLTLHDVSPVTYPAYEATTAEAASSNNERNGLIKSFWKYKESQMDKLLDKLRMSL